MKKLMILLAVACLVFVSCGPCNKKTVEVTEEKTCTFTPEQEAMFENWEMWADLDAELQVALVGEMKAFIDECKAKCEAKCEAKCKEAKEECGEVKEECPEKAAKCAEFKAKWEDFENLSLEDQKAILDQVLECMKAKCCKEKGEGEGCCKKDKEGCHKDNEETCAH